MANCKSVDSPAPCEFGGSFPDSQFKTDSVTWGIHPPPAVGHVNVSELGRWEGGVTLGLVETLKIIGCCGTD